MQFDSDLIMICTHDIAGQLRGKAVPRRDVQSRSCTGIGWTPTNALITSFGPIAPSPWGALGDLYIQPDFSTQVDLNLPEAGIYEAFVLGNIKTLDGNAWECCLRSQLTTALARLKEQHGLMIRASFEHEFHYSNSEAQPGLGYAYRAFRRLGKFPNKLMHVLDAAGLTLDTFMPEYGPGQCEVTIGHQTALRAADEAIILQELVRATARGLDGRASFSPMLDPEGVGNGLHLHFSFTNIKGGPVSYDPECPHGVSKKAGAFVAGVLKYMPDFLAFTASSIASYLRLTPHRWSAAFNNFGKQDREAAVRICPVFQPESEAQRAKMFNFEYRAADATASPYLILAALINAGVAGIDERLNTPKVTHQDISALSDDEHAEHGVTRLPQTLEEALKNLTGSEWAADSFGQILIDTFDRHKRAEIEFMSGMTDDEICEHYYKAY
ncbi:MAG: glutamine synthetase [Hyphomicrobiales bacterium]